MRLTESFTRFWHWITGRRTKYIWSLVGNIVDEHPFGDQKEKKRGTKHFSPGTKVYCFPPQWGDGYEKIYVIGRPRQTTQFIKVIIKSRLVTNWRIQKVYSPFIMQAMAKNGWSGTEESKKQIESMIRSIKAYSQRRDENG